MTLLRAMSPAVLVRRGHPPGLLRGRGHRLGRPQGGRQARGADHLRRRRRPDHRRGLDRQRRHHLQDPGPGAGRRRQPGHDPGPQGRPRPADPPVAPGRPDDRPRKRAAADLPAAAAGQPSPAREGPRALPREVLRHQPLPPGQGRPLPDQPQVQPGRPRRPDDPGPAGLRQRHPLHPPAAQGQRPAGPHRRHRPPGQPPAADHRRAGRRRAAQGLPQAAPHRPGADEPQGRRGHDAAVADQPQEHQRGDRVLLRPRRAVAGRRPDQPAGAAHPRAAALGPGPRRAQPQARRLRGPRRPHLALRPDLPDRDPGRDEHRADQLAGHLRRRRRVRLPGHALPQDQARQDAPTRSSGCGPTRRARPTWPRPTRRSTITASSRGPTLTARYQTDFVTVPVDQIQFMDISPKQMVGVSAGLDPVPGARRRQPGAHGLEHAAPGRAAAGGRAADRRHRAGAVGRHQLGHGRQGPAGRHGHLRRLDPGDHRPQPHLQAAEVRRPERADLPEPEADRPGRPEGQEGRHPGRRRLHLQGRAGAGPQRPGRLHGLGRLQLRGRHHHQREAGARRRLHLDPHRGVRDRDPRDQARPRGVHPRHPQRLGEGAAQPRRQRRRPDRHLRQAGRHPGRQGRAQEQERADARGEAAARDLRPRRRGRQERLARGPLGRRGDRHQHPAVQPPDEPQRGRAQGLREGAEGHRGRRERRGSPTSTSRWSRRSRKWSADP